MFARLTLFFFFIALTAACGAGGGGDKKDEKKDEGKGGTRKCDIICINCRRRSASHDVVSVIVSSKSFSPLTHKADMTKVENEIHAFSSSSGLNFNSINAIDREAENVKGKIRRSFRVVGEAEKCQRVTQFVQAAVNEINDVSHGFVKCGAFESIKLSKM
ncbi:hypothetical protein PENTCL1PPCAC_1445 [Pristionchus entomophagus]|uniref:Uncharacterized protein n=1 Tax=Pristionchus entomophagus TaxID=358040 RepID=A0AAV5SAJ4_9BILA|nr:hypothetical protein PENTCL1PPCAC_1445 [Pristionchus entomophagus]